MKNRVYRIGFPKWSKGTTEKKKEQRNQLLHFEKAHTALMLLSSIALSSE